MGRISIISKISNYFQWKLFLCRFNFMEWSRSEQSFVILGHLESHQRIKELDNEYGKQNKQKSSRYCTDAGLNCRDISMFIADIRVCQKMYFFIHNIGRARYRNLMEHFNTNGVSVRQHKLTYQVPHQKNVLSADDINTIVRFITKSDDSVAIPLLGRMPQFRDFKVMKLPSCENKTAVYRRYKNAASSEKEMRVVEESSIRKL